MTTFNAWSIHLDRLIGRLLWVNMAAQSTEQCNGRRAKQALGLSLVFSAVRCILQYVILPFVLPLVGIATDAAVPMLLIMNIVAMISIFLSLRRFWQIGYKYRWQYLSVAVVAWTLLMTFALLDIQTLFRS